MKSRKKLCVLILSSVIALSFTACGRTGTGSKEADGALTAFNTIVKTYPQNKGFHNALQHWGFKLPGDNKFEWTKDTSANKIDYAMVMQADPLIKAGLDVSKLDNKDLIYKPAEVEDGMQQPNRILHTFNVSDKKETSSSSEDAFRRLLKDDTSMIKYNKDEKHYMLMLGESYEVHWTENLGSSDEDMEFVIPAAPLLKAGLDVKKLDGTGWKLEQAGKDNMDAKEDQLVRAFKLK